MQRHIAQSVAAAAIAAAAIAGSAAPSMATTARPASVATHHTAVKHPAGSNHGFIPGPAPANQTRTSHTSQNAWASWNQAGGQVGTGAAGLISSAFFGIPSWILDTVSGVLHALLPHSM
jgi:hypothetical protein